MTTSAFRSLFSGRAVLYVAIAVGLGGCRAVAESYSPWTTGFGLKVSPGFAMGEAEDGPTVHPSLSISRMEGGSNWVELGGQIRWHLNLFDQDVWTGAEAMAGRISGTTGFAGSALFGVPIGDNRWHPSVYASVGFTNYSTTGRVVSAGIDLQPWFLPGSF